MRKNAGRELGEEMLRLVEQQLLGLLFNKSRRTRALPLRPPTAQTKRQRCAKTNNLTSESARSPWGSDAGHLIPWCQAPGSPTRRAVPPGQPYVPLCGCYTYYLLMYIPIWWLSEPWTLNNAYRIVFFLHSNMSRCGVSASSRCICTLFAYMCGRKVCVYVCLKREGRVVHQISHLIWAASGEVKGAVGRLSSRRRGGVKKKKETESRWCECERGWEGGREAEARGVKRRREADKEWKRWSKRMFTLVMLVEDKRGHQYVLPPIGPQDIEWKEGELIAENTRWGNSVADTSLPRSQTNRLIKHKPHECSLAASVRLDARTCVSTVHLSRPPSWAWAQRAICKSNLAFNDTGNHLNLLKKPAWRGKGACSTFRSEMHKIATLLCPRKRALSAPDFKWWDVSRWMCGGLIARVSLGVKARRCIWCRLQKWHNTTL